MSQVYSGDPRNISTRVNTRARISSSTNATPIVVTTVAAHGFLTNDFVEVEGHLVNTAANGVWQVVVLSATTFQLVGSVGNGVGAGTGAVRDLSLVQDTLPSDGDDERVVSINPALQNNADKLAFLNQRLGKYRLLDTYALTTTDDTFAAWVSAQSLTTSAWIALTGTSNGFFTSAWTNPVPTCNQNDLFEVLVSTTCTTSGVSKCPLGVGFSQNGGAYAIATGSAVRVPASYDGILLAQASILVASGGNGQSFGFNLMGFGSVGSPPTVSLFGHRSMLVRHWRPPQ